MDEGLAGCVGIIVVVAIVLAVLASVFIFLTQIFGHPVVVVALLGVVGGFVGLIQLDRAGGRRTPGSDADYAAIGDLRMLPRQWATLVLVVFGCVVGLYGIVVL